MEKIKAIPMSEKATLIRENELLELKIRNQFLKEQLTSHNAKRIISK